MKSGSEKKYWNGAHTKYRVMMHLVWCPKYRRRVLVGKLKERLEELFKECAEINGWKIEELSINKDHVHMLLRIKPNISISKAVQLLKGGSSIVIRKEFPELQEFLWGDSLWSDGCFVDTTGSIDEKSIREYIQNQ